MVRNVEEVFTRYSGEGFSPDVQMTDLDGSFDESTGNGPQGFDELDDGHRSQSVPIPSIEGTHARDEGTRASDDVFPRLVVAVDFGTTFSSVAFVHVQDVEQSQTLNSQSVACIDHYPDMPPGGSATLFETNPTVPTELLVETAKAKIPVACTHQDESSDHDSDVLSMDGIWNAPDNEENGEPAEDQNIPSVHARVPLIRNSIWGWGVHANIARNDTMSTSLKHLKNFKLLLDESDDAVALREESNKQLKALKGVKTVDVIADYLAQLLGHAKQRLIDSHRLRPDSPVEIVLCVPTSWSAKASRVMQNALAAAVKASRITSLKQGAIEHFFIVAESEAAATYALDLKECGPFVTALQSFMVLDCGGGTVDGVTYTMTRSEPLRLREVVPPKGTSCGSSFLNKNYRTMLVEKLKNLTFVGCNSPSERERVITKLVEDFEHEKRSIDITDKHGKISSVFVQGLYDDKLGYVTNRLEITRRDMYDVFKPCLMGVQKLMLDQLDAAKKNDINVRTVILIGGFGESPSLKGHLEKILQQQVNMHGTKIKLVRPNYLGSAVARGAVLRALRKEAGPERFTRSSYGVLRTERYNDQDPTHRRSRVYRDNADGELYLGQTINWEIQKDSRVQYRHEVSIRAMHCFKEDATQFLCEEVLYVSSNEHESGFKVGHPKNKGAEELGKIVIDLTRLKADRSYVRTSTNRQGRTFSFYQIEYDLWIIIEGLMLRFEARSPEGDDQVTSFKTFNIAAGFLPGTR